MRVNDEIIGVFSHDRISAGGMRLGMENRRESLDRCRAVCRSGLESECPCNSPSIFSRMGIVCRDLAELLPYSYCFPSFGVIC